MGKASKKRQSLQAGEQTRQQTDRPTCWEAGLFYRPVIHVLIIVVLGLLVYSNTFQSPFQWDEVGHIVANPVVKDLGYFTDISRAEGLPVYDGLKSRYIGYLTFALNYKFHGFNVLGYHVVNLAIHLINAVLVYFLVLLTFRTPFFSYQRSAISNQRTEGGNQQSAVNNQPSSSQVVELSNGRVVEWSSGTTQPLNYSTFHHSHLFAFAVALLFVSHPIQTEAVTYVFQRLASLVSLFYLLSLVLYIKGRLSVISGQPSSSQVVEWSSGTTQLLNYSTSSPFTFHASRFTIVWYLLSLLSAVLAMKTKENAFTLPVIITLYEFLFFSGLVKTRLLRLAPFLLTMLIVPLTIMGTGSSAGEIISQVKDPVSLGYVTPTPADYLFTQFRVIVTYLRLLFWPAGQTLLYDYPIYQSFFTPPVFLSFLFLAAIFVFGVYLVYKTRGAISGQRSAVSPQRTEEASKQYVVNSMQTEKDSKQYAVSSKQKEDESAQFTAYSLLHSAYLRLAAFGILWFFITLSVESSIIPIPMVIDEYRVYLPSVGFFISVIAGAMLLLQRFTGRSKQYAVSSKQSTPYSFAYCLLPTAYFLIILALASATYVRNIVWKDKVSLWQDIVSKSPGFGMGYDNLGLVYEEMGRREEAVVQFRKAIQLAPEVATPHLNLGYTLEAMGRLEDAIAEYQTVLRLDPRNWQAHLNLGSSYGKKGLADKAIEELQAALKIAPNSAAVFINLGNAYRQKGEGDKAIDQYLAALRLKPDYADAHYNLGDTYEQKGEADRAIEHYLAALKSNPDHVGAHYNLGRVYVKTRQLDKAIAELEAAVRLGPGNSVYLNTLGVLYGQKGSYDKAIEQFEAALRLVPDNAAYRQNLEKARGLKSGK